MHRNEFSHYANTSIIHDGGDYDYDEADCPLVNYGQGGTLELDRDDDSFHATSNSPLSLAYESLKKRHALLEQQFETLLQINVNSPSNNNQNAAVSPRLLLASSKAASPATANGNGVGSSSNSYNQSLEQQNQQLLEELNVLQQQNNELKAANKEMRQKNERLQREVDALSQSSRTYVKPADLTRANADNENDSTNYDELKAVLHAVRRLKHAAQRQNAALSAQCRSKGLLRKVNADPASIADFSGMSLTSRQLAQCSDAQEDEEQFATLAIGQSNSVTRLADVTRPLSEATRPFAHAARPSVGPSAYVGPSAAAARPSVGPSAAVSWYTTPAAVLTCSQQAAAANTGKYGVDGSMHVGDTDADNVFTTFHKSNLGRGLALERDSGAMHSRGLATNNDNAQLPLYRNRGSDSNIVGVNNNLSLPKEFNVGSAAMARSQSARLAQESDVADVQTSGYYSGRPPNSASAEIEQAATGGSRETKGSAPRLDRVCPICLGSFANLRSQFDFEQHVNDCIDSRLSNQHVDEPEPVTITNDDVDSARRDETVGTSGGRYESDRRRYEDDRERYEDERGRYEDERGRYEDERGRYETDRQNERGRYDARAYSCGGGQYGSATTTTTVYNDADEDLECEDCGGLFFTLQQFLQHRQSHATKFSNLAEQEPLYLSNQVLPSSDDFQQHNVRQCPVCDQVFDANTLESEMEAHTNSHFILDDQIQEF